MKIAVVHDRLTVMGGAERLVGALLRAWPSADLYAAVADHDLARSHGLPPVRTTYLGRLPGAERLQRASLPLHPHAFGRLRLDGYDCVVSSSAFFAKCVRPPLGVPHIAYCHTPPRFLWDLRATHLRHRSGRAERALVRTLGPALRRTDRRSAARVDVLVANSTFVADSIRRSYGRSAVVVPPPVDVERCGPPRVDHDGYVLVVSRLDPYKRVDLAIRACQEAGLPLRVVGDGVDAARLAGLAGPGVELLGWVDEDRKIELLRGAMALVAPQVEDFGIAMVEALAAGTPVVAPAAGGAVDIVEDGVTGVLYDPDDTEGLSTALARVADLPVDAAVMGEASARFAEARFADAMTELVERAVAAPVASA